MGLRHPLERVVALGRDFAVGDLATVDGHAHLHVGVRVIDAGYEAADFHVETDLVEHYATERVNMGLPHSHGTVWKLPQPCQESVRGSFAKQVAASFRDDTRDELVKRHGLAGSANGTLILRARGAGLALVSDGTCLAERVARNADARAELHEALVEVAGRDVGHERLGGGPQGLGRGGVVDRRVEIEDAREGRV